MYKLSINLNEKQLTSLMKNCSLIYRLYRQNGYCNRESDIHVTMKVTANEHTNEVADLTANIIVDSPACMYSCEAAHYDVFTDELYTSYTTTQLLVDNAKETLY